MKKISIYTDGSALGNPGHGGYCAFLVYKGKERVVSGGEELTTNNRMELKAVIEALRVLKEPCEVELVSDSSYVVKAINIWLKSWIEKGFKKVKNVDLWQEYLLVSKDHKINAHWIRGHTGHVFNEKCDKIAKEEALVYKKNG